MAAMLKLVVANSVECRKFSRSSVDISSEGNFRGKARDLKATEFAQRSGKFAQRKREDYHDRSDRLVPFIFEYFNESFMAA